MATLSEALAIALEHHRAGRLDLAEEICRRILAVVPNHADALHLMGVMALENGDDTAAMAHITRAMAIDPAKAEYHYTLAQAFRRLGRTDEEIGCYRRAVTLDPGLAYVYNNLASALQAQGNADEAEACYRKALELKPDWAAYLYNLANCLQEVEELDEAVTCYRRAIELAPEFAEAHHRLCFSITQVGTGNVEAGVMLKHNLPI